MLMVYHYSNPLSLVYIWPLYFIINELPYIIAGLWFGESKPNMNAYLKPIVKELIALHGTAWGKATYM